MERGRSGTGRHMVALTIRKAPRTLPGRLERYRNDPNLQNLKLNLPYNMLTLYGFQSVPAARIVLHVPFDVCTGLFVKPSA